MSRWNPPTNSKTLLGTSSGVQIEVLDQRESPRTGDRTNPSLITLDGLLPHEELEIHSTPGRSTSRRWSPTPIRSSHVLLKLEWGVQILGFGERGSSGGSEGKRGLTGVSGEGERSLFYWLWGQNGWPRFNRSDRSPRPVRLVRLSWDIMTLICEFCRVDLKPMLLINLNYRGLTPEVLHKMCRNDLRK